MYKRNIEARSRHHRDPETAIRFLHSACVSVAFGIQHAMYMRHFFLSVICPAVQYFSTFSHIGHDFRGKKLLNIEKCFVFLYKFFRKFLILRRTNIGIITSIPKSSRQVPTTLVRFQLTSNILDRF
jgi:hypothetical protein